jgi:hypothetical protein
MSLGSRTVLNLGRILVAVLFVASLGIVAQTPEPFDTGDMEMGAAAPSSARTKVDQDVLARFDAAYRRAGSATRPVFDMYLPILGTATLLDYLERRFPDCHSQGHDLGRALYALRKDVGIALREVGTRCSSAVMHGVIGEAFGTTDLGSIARTMNEFCAADAVAEIHRPGNCAHGIGHALMFTTGDDVDRSLNACLYFSVPGMRYYCATGVFMEYLVPKRKGMARPVLHDPCDLYPRYAAACYRYRAKTMLSELGGDRDRLLRECQSLQGSLRLGCFHGLGATLTGRLIGDPALLGRFCGRGDAKDRIMCIEGAIEKLADQDETKAMSACAMLEGGDKEVCTAAAKWKMYRLDKPSMPLYHDSKLVETRQPLVVQPMAHEHHHP